MSKNIIECDNLYKIYKTEDDEVFALQGLDFTIEEGELMAIIGSSGSGKSSLLNILGGLDKPTTGKLFVDGIDMFKLSERQMRLYRRNTVGFVWQNSGRNLLSHLTAFENIELIARMSNSREKSRKIASDLLEMVGMASRMNNKVSQMSGGEQQRVAIAIALANNPRILLADEPTGSVDSKTCESIFDLFKHLNKNLNLTIIIVTHDMQVAHNVKRVVSISEGKISKELIAKESYAMAANGESIVTNIDNEDTHEEFLILDRHNRVQIPEQFLEEINIKKRGKIKAKLEEDRIILHSGEKN
ncbi:ABC transporter ATP-binding protein [Clostridium sp. 19966]|uniref:ABC transporter ATP-binding protein n=1 Tax=Clostridium sp. 19966 TaxID=2768166 RepID=UPI0028EF562E|nr:ABC transporter ATP-binding protein [Clostridium sp. 19966]